MRSEVPPALAAARSSYRPAAKAHARTAEHLPLHSRTDPPCSHRRRVALEGTSSPYTAMSTSGQGAVLDRMDTTSHPSPGSQGAEPPPPPGPRDEAGAADGGNRPGASHAATSSSRLNSVACIAQDGPLTCSERPRTSALRRRDCTWSSEQRRRQKHFPLQRLQLLRNAIRRELQPRAGYRLVLRLPLQRCDARNDHVVCQWAPQNIAAQAPRYNAVLQHAN